MADRTTLSILPVALLLVGPAFADTIYLTNGKAIDDVEIQSEGLQKVSYKEGRNTAEVRSDEVLSIEFTTKPQLLDRAESALADEAYQDAAADLEEFIAGVLSRPPRKHPWSPPYAMFRLVEVYETVGEVELMLAAADKLLANAPESRYAPLAYLKKADALFDSGKAPQAQEVVRAFANLLSEKQLAGRWKMEADLRKILFDTTLSAAKRKQELEALAAEAGASYPTVRNRAEVAIGETLLEAKDFENAEKTFRRVTEDPQADDRTLATAWTGLGDCLYQKAANLRQDDKTRPRALRDALMAYMRVVVVYKEQPRYVPKAMFYAGRAFDLMGDDEAKDRAQTMYSRVMRSYRGSKWADEARGFRK